MIWIVKLQAIYNVASTVINKEHPLVVLPLVPRLAYCGVIHVDVTRDFILHWCHMRLNVIRSPATPFLVQVNNTEIIDSFFMGTHWSLEVPLTKRPGPVFCLLLGVSSDYAPPITGQVTEVTCPVIGWAQPELTPSKRQKTGPGLPVMTPLSLSQASI